MNTWIIGSGGMAKDYLAVLRNLGIEITVIGRGEETAAKFESETGFPVVRGGLDNYVKKKIKVLPDNVIVAVGIENLAKTTSSLLKLNIKKILVEKPAGLNSLEIAKLNSEAFSYGAKVYVAYNRRFYSSVIEAKKIIESDGGVKSYSFEFTEWGHEIEKLHKANGVKENWVLANSSHVLDLAFYLGGIPEEINTMQAGNLKWHPNASVFCGSGRAKNGALFSYQANWAAPGRWGVELCTNDHRLILRPLEELSVMRKGIIKIESFNGENDEIDRTYKPGLFLQTKEFIFEKESNQLCDLEEHTKLLKTYKKIAGYR